MSTQINSVRLQRLAKTTQLRKMNTTDLSPKQTLKLAAMNSIMYSVKKNDLNSLTGRQLNKLRIDPQASSDLQFTSAHENLKQIRCKYDSVHRQRIDLDSKINKLRDQLGKYKKTESQFNDNKTNGKDNVLTLNNNLLQFKGLSEQASTQKKVLENMRNRLKKDKVFYDQRKYDLNKLLNYFKKQQNLYIADTNGILEQQDRCKKMANKLLNHVKQQQMGRQQHVSTTLQLINEKRKVVQNNDIRKIQMIEIAERAMQDKDQNQKEWGKLFLVQKMVSKLLRDKMFKEMDKFYVVETAFKNIKISTGVTDAYTFTTKFLNKQTAYGQLLNKIAENQTKIQGLKLQSSQLNKQHKILEEQQKELLQIRRKQHNLIKQQKQLQSSEQKRSDCQLLKSKLKLWVLKIVRKFKHLGEKFNQDLISNKTTDVTKLFKEYLNVLAKCFDQCQEMSDEILPLDQINPQYKDKLFRVKTISKRKNSIGEQINPVFEEQQINNINQQTETVESERQNILRNNDKFMKELKKKYDDIKRAKIQAQPKKKQPVIEKPKQIIEQ